MTNDEATERDPEDFETWDVDEDYAVRYVEPTWGGQREDDELSKCAVCSRFFVQRVPLRFFQTIDNGTVLGYEVCDNCAAKALAGRLTRQVG